VFTSLFGATEPLGECATKCVTHGRRDARPTVTFQDTEYGLLVAIHQTLLVLRRVKVRMYMRSRHVTNHSGQLSLLSSVGRVMSTGQSVLTLSGWRCESR